MNITPLILDVTKDAQADIAEIGWYYAQRNPVIKDRFYQSFDTTINTLAHSPTLGERCRFRNSATKGMRVWQVAGFPNYLIFYRPNGDQLEILRVFHAARDYAKVFDDES